MEMDEEFGRKWEKSQRRGKFAGGLLLAVIGALLLGRELGAELPQWLFSWKALLVGFGFVGLIKHGFTRMGWLIPIAIGSAFLLGDAFPFLAIKQLIWPSVLIFIGLIIAFKPRRSYKQHYFRHMAHQRHQRMFGGKYTTNTSSEDFIDSTAVMGGVQRHVLTKTLKGGDITSVLGGSEIDLTQADFEGTVEFEVTQVMGGTKIIVPAHWTIRSEIVTIMGGLEDKRPAHIQRDPNKVLVLRGTTVMGGIEIKTY